MSKRAQALRYLLLRHMYGLRGRAGAQGYARTAASLEVRQAGQGYTLAWERDAQAFRAEVPAGRFDFYRRGDVHPEERDLDQSLATDNDAQALVLAREILGLEILGLELGALPPAPPAPPRPGRVVEIGLLALAGLLPWALFIGSPGVRQYWWAWAVLPALLPLLELFPWGWALVPLALLALAVSPVAAPSLVVGLLLLAPAYTLLCLLERGAVRRWWGAAGSLAAWFLALARVQGLSMELGWSVANGSAGGWSAGNWSLMALLLLPALLLVAASSLHGVHRRAMPLVFPLFFPPLVMQGGQAGPWLALAVSGLVLAALGLMARIYAPGPSPRRRTRRAS